jgi:hypothetical protein
VRIEEVEEWVNSSKWKVWSIRDGVRIFEQFVSDDRAALGETPSSGSNLPPCLRVSMGVNGSVLDVSNAILNLPPACRTGAIKSLRVVETLNNNTEVVHIVLEPIFIYPTWTAPRDLCLMRYWKQNQIDGSYVICLDSTFHHDCPLLPGHVRADLHAVYTISPPRVRRIEHLY